MARIKSKEKDELNKYIKKKVKLINQLGYRVTTDFFSDCTNEVQVDQRAHGLLNIK